VPRPLRVAVVDGDRGFVLVLANRLQAIGGEARVFSSPPPTAELLAMRVSAVVFDAEHLGPRAFDFLGRLAGELPTAAVVVTAQNATLTQRVRGLRSGADHWVKKPCHAEEVVARIEAVLRRRDPLLGVDVGPLTAGDVEIRPDRFQVFANGRSADLTGREFDLLRLLAEAEGRVISREEIYANVWGYTLPHGDRSVDVFVRKVRAKLGLVSPDWDYIHTHFGIGYRFDPEARDASTATPKDEALEAEGTDEAQVVAPNRPAPLR
jgi:DNA-binding response OmpR family regulator